MPSIEVTVNSPGHLHDIATLIANSKKTVVFTGAGISTNCGIPDFRSKTGLYSLISAEYTAKASASSKVSGVSGRDLFDCSLWKDPTSTSVFYAFIASLRRKIRNDVEGTSHTHKFIRTLRDQGKLVRCYTQNIDGLENREGMCADLARGVGSRVRFGRTASLLPNSVSHTLPGGLLDRGCEVVQLHGDLDVLRCTICCKKCNWEEKSNEKVFAKGKAPFCRVCAEQSQIRQARGMRGTTIGSLRPNIVLYGEEHPSADELSTISTHDLRVGVDLLIIMGTSLKVHGLKVLVKEFSKAVHLKTGKKGKVVFVNLTRPPGTIWDGIIDYWVSMDCDAWVKDLHVRRPDLWQTQSELSLRVLKDVKNPPVGPRKTGLSKMQEDDKENHDMTGSTRSGKPKPVKKALTTASSPVVDDSEADSGTTFIETREEPKTPRKCWQLPTPLSSRDNPVKKSQKQPMNAQLLTPPPSREHRAARNGQQLLEANLKSSFHGDRSPRKVSKRKRPDITIWEDKEDEDTQEPYDLDGTAQGLRHKKLRPSKEASVRSLGCQVIIPPSPFQERKMRLPEQKVDSSEEIKASVTDEEAKSWMRGLNGIKDIFWDALPKPVRRI